MFERLINLILDENRQKVSGMIIYIFRIIIVLILIGNEVKHLTGVILEGIGAGYEIILARTHNH